MNKHNHLLSGEACKSDLVTLPGTCGLECCRRRGSTTLCRLWVGACPPTRLTHWQTEGCRQSLAKLGRNRARQVGGARSGNLISRRRRCRATMQGCNGRRIQHWNNSKCMKVYFCTIKYLLSKDPQILMTVHLQSMLKQFYGKSHLTENTKYVWNFFE